jgi:hypothetical protein
MSDFLQRSNTCVIFIRYSPLQGDVHRYRDSSFTFYLLMYLSTYRYFCKNSSELKKYDKTSQGNNAVLRVQKCVLDQDKNLKYQSKCLNIIPEQETTILFLNL